MKILIKSPEEIEKIRVASQLAADVLEMIAPHVVVGVSTGELDNLCHDYIVQQQQAIPACLNYNGFPKSVCISINEVVCHGIPSDERFLKNGDVVNIDVTVIKDGYFGDTSKMFIVGTPSILGKRLCDVTLKSLYYAIRIVKPGLPLRQIGKTIQSYVEKQGFSVVREYCGHGVGRHFHEVPQVLHYDADDGGVILEAGMTFTIEPMVNTGGYHIRLMKDEWTVKTKDRGLSAQYEHTLLVTEEGCEILTLRPEESLDIIFGND